MTTSPAPRLYLATPEIGEPAAIGGQLLALIGVADIAAVLLRLAAADERTQINRIKTLAPEIQAQGVAVLIEGHVGLVARAGADGAHVSGLDTLEGALRALKPQRMVGIGGLQSRHDSMIAGETGADYLLFGEPDARGQRPALAAIVERLQWWAEVFEPPCVGYAAALSEVGALAATGADFIMLGDAVWTDARGPAEALKEAAAIVAGTLAKDSET